jgi:hypothetical protein
MAEQEQPLSLPEMQRQLWASPGFRASSLISMINRYAYILQGNIAQYNSLVKAMQNPSYALPILDIRTPQRHDELLSESERLLHNVALAIKTRVDLQRVFMEKYFSEDTELRDVYAAKVGEIFDTDSAKFLEALRNHVTHHLLPVQRSVHTVFGSKPSLFEFVLDAQALLKWDWSARVRAWIDSQSPNIKIVAVVNDYGEKARRFDEWLTQEISRKYRKELSDYRAAAEIYNREHARVFGT